MARPSRKKAKEATTEANLLPIMSCMFLLIPALLLAMEVARHSAVPVNTPKTVSAGQSEDPPIEKIPKFSVRISADGFATAQGDASRTIDIPVLAGPGTLDYDALESRAAALRSLIPDRYTVYLSAEGDVELDTVVRTMDALRGRDCSLAGALQGERPGAGCHFWNVVIES